MTRFIVTAAMLLCLSGCKDYNIRIDENMRDDAQMMPVKGRQGVLINQKLSFGEFGTDRIKRGWTFKYNVPFFLRFEGAREKLSFTQFNELKQEARVAAVGRFLNHELPILGDYFGIPLKYEHYFAGTIYLPHNGHSYDFVVHNPEANFVLLPTSGFIKGPGLEAEIKGITKLDDRKVLNIDNLGFEFYAQNRSIGAVQIFNNGKVWIRKGLETEHRLVLAALSSSLMVRNAELSERITN